LAYQEDRAGSKELEQRRVAAMKEQNQKKQADQAKFEVEREKFDRANVYLSNLPPESLEKIREEAFNSLDEAKKAFVTRKSSVADLVMKLAMNKIARERMQLN
jgi:hypothetical protein